jgi:hypothetical protein
MTKRTAFVASLAILVQPMPAWSADEARVLAPSSAWTLDFADERCSLIREFGEGDEKTRLQIDSYGTKFGYRVLISGGLVQAATVAPVTEVRVGYSPDAGERERFYAMAGTSGDDKAISFTQGFLPDPRTIDAALLVPAPTSEQQRTLDRLASEFEGRVTNVTVQFARRKPLQLQTGNMAAPFAAMHKCVDDLIASWGFDPATHWARTRAPLLRPETVREVQRNYPAARAARGMGAFVPVRVSVDETGKATQCVVQVAVVDEDFKRTVCEGLLGSYDPALDAEGKPVASFLHVSTIYQIGR